MNRFLFITVLLVWSCKERNEIVESGFGIGSGFVNQALFSSDGVPCSLVVLNNPYELEAGDSLIIGFNNCVLVKNLFKKVYSLNVPKKILGRRVQTWVKVTHKGQNYFYVYKGYDLLVDENLDRKTIYLAFLIRNFSDEPYEFFIKEK